MGTYLWYIQYNITCFFLDYTRFRFELVDQKTFELIFF
jgi:hypothetical protein